jgi:hypothetical protein
MYHYFKAIKTAGYSGFVLYVPGSGDVVVSYWMVPGTFFYDWDN